MIIKNIAIGLLLLLSTIIIHGTVTRIVTSLVSRRSEKGLKLHIKAIQVSFIVLFMSAASLFESVIWAFSYLQLNVFQELEEALYFSVVTFTTLGYGDITLDPSWRLLASLEAANGIIIFGWSTALIYAAVQRLYFSSS